MRNAAAVEDLPSSTFVIAAGIAGTAILGSGIVLAIRAQADQSDAPFRVQNHFVSELGWTARSPLARIFNASIALGSLLFAPVVRALSVRLPTPRSLLARRFGFASITGASAIGFFPMDKLKPHLVVTLIFFMTWPVTVALFTISFWGCKAIGKAKLLVPVGMATLVSWLSLLQCPKRSLIAAIRAIDHHQPFTRPKIWWPAIFEWILLFCTWLWMATATALCGKTSKP